MVMKPKDMGETSSPAAAAPSAEPVNRPPAWSDIQPDLAPVSALRSEAERNDGKVPRPAHAAQSREVDFAGLKSTLLSEALEPLFWPALRQETPTAAWSGHIPFAHWLVHAARPRTIVELGTHAGVSYSAFCEAVIRSKTETRCFAVDTWKGDEQAGFYDESIFADLQQFHEVHYAGFSKLMRMTFDEAVSTFDDGSIDLLHIDGLHRYADVRHDFEMWLPKVSAAGIVLFHDTNEYQNDFGVWRLWAELQDRYPSFEFLHGHGLGVLCVGDGAPAPVLAMCQSLDVQEVTAVRTRFQYLGDRWSIDGRARVEQRAAAARARESEKKATAALAAARGAAELEKAAALQRADADKTAAVAAAFRKAHDENVAALAAARKEDAQKVDEERRRLLAERDQVKRDASVETATTNLELRRLRAFRTGIASTVSWRITAPIRSIQAILLNLRGLRDYHALKQSGLFDPEWYVATYLDVAESGLDPLLHYLRHGALEGRNPSPDFDTNWYLAEYPDVAADGINPLVHYLTWGAAEGRTSRPPD